jgi:hypothetical protein
VVGVVGLSLDPDPFSEQSAVLLAIGASLLTVTTVSGVALARGRWSRWMALVVSTLWFGEAIARPLDAAGVATIIVAVAAASIAAGPWLGRWLRHLPAVNAPAPTAVLLLLLLISTPATVGLITAGGRPGPAGWTLSVWSLLLALGLARAIPQALWAGRIGHLPVSIAGIVILGVPAAIVIGTKMIIETTILWRRDLHLAVSPMISDRSPGIPIPPELVDPTIMKAAGLDDRGRPLENS